MTDVKKVVVLGGAYHKRAYPRLKPQPLIKLRRGPRLGGVVLRLCGINQPNISFFDVAPSYSAFILLGNGLAIEMLPILLSILSRTYIHSYNTYIFTGKFFLFPVLLSHLCLGNI